jgi:hypothetical protein
VADEHRIRHDRDRGGTGRGALCRAPRESGLQVAVVERELIAGECSYYALAELSSKIPAPVG